MVRYCNEACRDVYWRPLPPPPDRVPSPAQAAEAAAEASPAATAAVEGEAAAEGPGAGSSERGAALVTRLDQMSSAAAGCPPFPPWLLPAHAFCHAPPSLCSCFCSLVALHTALLQHAKGQRWDVCTRGTGSGGAQCTGGAASGGPPQRAAGLPLPPQPLAAATAAAPGVQLCPAVGPAWRVASGGTQG